MENLPPWATKAIQIWLTIGTILTLVGTKLIPIPAFIPAFFSQEFVSAVLAVVGAVITFWQIIRATVASHPSNAAKLASSENKTAYMLNPFKLAA
jgi:hypothetical protein